MQTYQNLKGTLFRGDSNKFYFCISIPLPSVTL
jgi:hypothetical protein